MAQVAGAIVAAGLLVILLRGQPQGYDPSVGGLAANGFGEHSPAHFRLLAVFLAETFGTMILVTTVLGATGPKKGRDHGHAIVLPNESRKIRTSA